MQNWFNLSDPGAEDALYHSESMRRFAGIELAEDVIPDESTILRFWHLLERFGLTEQIFAAIRGLLEEKRLLLKSGTIVDATIIAAPPSTKNAEKAHVGTDKRGIVHTLVTTPAHAADINQLPQRLHGNEKERFGAQTYWPPVHGLCVGESVPAQATLVAAGGDVPPVKAMSRQKRPDPDEKPALPAAFWSSP